MAAKLYGIVPDDTMVAETSLPPGAIEESREDMDSSPPPATEEDPFPTLEESVGSILDKKRAPALESAPPAAAAPAPAPAMPAAVDDPEIDFDGVKMPRSQASRALRHYANSQETMRQKLAEMTAREAKLAEREKLFDEGGGVESTLAARKNLGTNAPLFDQALQDAYQKVLDAQANNEGVSPYVLARLEAMQKAIEDRFARITPYVEEQQTRLQAWQQEQLHTQQRSQIAEGFKKEWGEDLTSERIEWIHRTAIATGQPPRTIALGLFGPPKPQAPAAAPRPGPRIGGPTPATAPLAPQRKAQPSAVDREAALEAAVMESLERFRATHR